MRILDVRHEQTAVFAAEAVGKLTRVPGLAVLTAGPGVTNGVSADHPGAVQRLAAGRGRRPGTGQPLGHGQPAGARPPAAARAGDQAARAPCTRSTRSPAPSTRRSRWPAPRTAGRPSSTCRWTSSSTRRPSTARRWRAAARLEADPDALAHGRRAARRRRRRPVLVLGTDVWADGAEEAALRFVEQTGVPVVTNGMGRGVVPGGHPQLVTKARGRGVRHRRPGRRRRHAAGLPARLRRLRRQGRRAPAAQVVHLADSPGQVSRHAELAASASGDLTVGARRGAGRAGVAAPQARLVRLGRRPAGRGRGAAVERDARAAALRGRPDPPRPHLRRAGPPAGRRRGGDRRRRRLRVLRRQVRRAQAARRLARPGPLRLPRRRPRLGDRGPASPGPRRRSCCCSATAPPACR